MLIGSNVTGTENFTNGYCNILDDVDFCEILIDSFFHYPLDNILEISQGKPIAFHVMRSRFIECERDELDNSLEKLRILIDQINPVYVSDHMAVFRWKDWDLPLLAEFDYHYTEQVIERIDYYQDKIDRRLFIENFPSRVNVGRPQADFFSEIVDKTGAGILFDCSNAIVAELNGIQKASDWLPLLEPKMHMHIAGYGVSPDSDDLILDTHDRSISDKSIEFLKKVRDTIEWSGSTIVVERDDNVISDEILSDIGKIKSLDENGSGHSNAA